MCERKIGPQYGGRETGMKIPAKEKLQFERALQSEGAEYVAALDEVGRGPLAGPVVCAAVIMPLNDTDLIEGVDDSKKLSEKERERLSALIIERALAYKICEVSHTEIDRLTILEATKLCMLCCIEGLSILPDAVLLDGNFRLDLPMRQNSVVGGDALSYSIGAASIIAKVYRDHLMCEMDSKYPQYGFAQHKGYGTKAHLDAIGEYGLCEIHRKTFTRKFWENREKN